MPDLPLPKPQAPIGNTPSTLPTSSPAGAPPLVPPPSALVTPPPGIPVATSMTGTAVAPPPAPPRPASQPMGIGSPMNTTPNPSLAPKPATPIANSTPPTAPAPAPSNPQIQAAGGKKQPVFAQISNSPFKFIPIVLGVLVVIGIIGFIAMRFLGGSSSSVSVTPPNTTGSTNTGNTNSTGGTSTNTPTTPNTTSAGKKTTLTYWGLWETSATFEQVLTEFETANPTIDVNYVQQRHPDYRERLQTAIASKNGPDVFRFHASWTPMLKEELANMPSSVMSVSEYKSTFYPVAAQQLQLDGQVVGIPLMYDGLALYYNKEVFEKAGLQPPKTWAELKTQAAQLTVRSSTGIERAGVAMGNVSNVEHFSDIIGLLMLQNGADLNDPTTKEAQEALQFYTNFMKVDKVWSDTLPNSTTAFARGEVAMMFAPSWRAHEVLALNPNLQFGITSMPSLGTDKVAWASYWAEGVNDKSDAKDAGWKLLDYLSSKEVMQKLYSDQAKVRTFGEPYSRVDLADTLATDPYVSTYLKDAPNASSWYLNSYTHDNGINDLLIKYYADAVNAVLANKTPAEAMKTVDQGTTQVLRQYGGS